MKIYCNHVWVTYIADKNGGKVPYEFCHHCRTTYLPGQGLVRPQTVIGYTEEPNVDA